MIESAFARRNIRSAIPLAVALLGLFAGGAGNPLHAQEADPRIGLGAGWLDAEQAAENMELIATRPRPPGFFDPSDPGAGGFSNTDLAFRDHFAFVGNYHGIQIYDISDPGAPELRATLVCPGGQGDVSIHRNLLFMSVEETRGRIDCGAQGVDEAVSPERFRGVRIFDVSDLDRIRQVAAVQTCRGSHTHTLVEDPSDSENLYVYVSGTNRPRAGTELAGCSDAHWQEDPNTSYWRIEVIQVPLSSPESARVVAEPRVFASDRTLGALWGGGDHGAGTQTSSQTNQCHDITVYPEIGLAAGACSGNGILFDISDVLNPVRIDEVVDPSFAYWHSATFNNDGTKVVFTDEWGGGSAPRCRASDPMTWGANAIFDVVDGRLRFASYYKLPVVQTSTENCVAHNGSLIPVPGRDIKVQSWYQGGISVFDFTDSANPFEIAFFDRGPVSADRLSMAGHWSSYWYNGFVYGSEISRGFDVLRMLPSDFLSENEIEAARLARFESFNPQLQPKIIWPPSFVVSRAYLDQLERTGGIPSASIARAREDLSRAENLLGPDRRTELLRIATGLESEIDGAADAQRLRRLVDSVREIADAHS